MTEQELLNRLLKFDFSALPELATFANTDRKACAELAWTFLQKVNGWDDPGLAIEVLRLLLTVQDRQTVEKQILDNWPNLTRTQRLTLLYGPTSDPSIVSTDFAIRLFNEPSSGIEDRANIFGGLMDSIDNRSLEDLLLSLLERMGPCQSKDMQERYNAFISGMKKGLENRRKVKRSS